LRLDSARLMPRFVKYCSSSTIREPLTVHAGFNVEGFLMRRMS
jgi:hypothetical protein